MKNSMSIAALMFTMTACGTANDSSAIKTCLASPNGSTSECTAPGAAVSGGPIVGDIFTFDLEPTSDKNSLQAALYWGMKTLHEIDGGDTLIEVELVADGIYSMDDGNTMLLCMTQGAEYGCGFTMNTPDAAPEAKILDLGTSTSDQSVQAATMVFMILYQPPFGPDSTIAVTAIENTDAASYVFDSSTAIMTSTATIAPDALSISYGLKIELK